MGHLPRYLGDDGNITYATRIPQLLRSTAVDTNSTADKAPHLEPTTEIASNTSSVATVVPTDPSSHRNESERIAAKEEEEIDIKQIIVGSVVGGFMLLILLGSMVGVWLAWRRSVRLREGKGVEFEMQDRGVDDVGRSGGESERQTP
jgi:hypothetical protein